MTSLTGRDILEEHLLEKFLRQDRLLITPQEKVCEEDSMHDTNVNASTLRYAHAFEHLKMADDAILVSI